MIGLDTFFCFYGCIVFLDALFGDPIDYRPPVILKAAINTDVFWSRWRSGWSASSEGLNVHDGLYSGEDQTSVLVKLMGSGSVEVLGFVTRVFYFYFSENANVCAQDTVASLAMDKHQ